MRFLPLFAPHSYINQPIPEVRTFLNKTLASGIELCIATHEHAVDYLNEYRANVNNYNAIRSDVSLYLNWCWQVKHKDVSDINRADFQEFIQFCNEPPEMLISRSPLSIIDKKRSQFELVINEAWKPFCNKNTGRKYARNVTSIKAQISILSAFYSYLDDVDFSEINPAARALKRLNPNNMVNVVSTDNDIEKAPNKTQSKYIFKAVEKMAASDPDKHERTRFLIYMLTFLFPRISEVSARPSHSPMMSDFKRYELDTGYGYAFHIPTSKNGRSRNVTCSSLFLAALKRYRTHLGLKGMPTSTESLPLFTRHQAASHGREKGVVDANLGKDQIAELVNQVLNVASELLMEDNYIEDAKEILRHSCHSFRHLGITLQLDAGKDPRSLIRDTGHSSVVMLDKYHSRHIQERFLEKDIVNSLASTIIS